MSPVQRPSLSGFQSAELTRRDDGLWVARGTRTRDRRAVLFKLCERADSPAAGALRREHELLQGLPADCIERPLTLAADALGRLVLVLERSELPTLAERFSAGARPSLDQLLALARRLATTLARVHERGVIHGHLTPSEVLVNDELSEIKLRGFTDAPRPWTRALQGAPVRALELRYTAPEQTGRMRRGVDQRADLYSLGAILYELLCGQPPFATQDPRELLHALLARRPETLLERGVELPPRLSAMIDRLLRKNAEDRFASGRELADALAAIGDDDDLAAPRALTIPDRLYGRARELKLLRDELDAARLGVPRLVVITGAAGLGKTALAGSLRGALREQGGVFVVGNFESLHRNRGLAVLLKALAALSRRALSLTEVELTRLRARVLDALGALAGTLARALPEARPLLGREDAARDPELAPPPSLHERERALARLLVALASPQRPTLLLLDNLEWVDAATLRVLELALTARERGGGLLIVGAADSAALPADHPLPSALGSLERQRLAVTRIELAPLTRDDVGALLRETLTSTPGADADLDRDGLAAFGELAHRRASGSPFELREYLRFLHETDQLRFDRARGRWRWDLDELAQADGHRDAEARLQVVIDGLPAPTRDLLEDCACLGTLLPLRETARALGRAPEQLSRQLAACVEQGVLYTVTGERDAAPALRFVHDRVRVNIYSRLAADARARRHLAIGRRLRALAAATPPAATLADFIPHLNLGLARLDTNAARDELADLNLEAARTEALTGAHEEALALLRAGARALNPAGDGTLDAASWRRAPARCVAITGALSERLLALGRLTQASIHAQELVEHARDELERARGYLLLTEILTSQGRADEARRAGLTGLETLGAGLPDSDEALREAAARADRELRAFRREHDLSSLLDRPIATDARARLQMGLLHALVPSVTGTHPLLLNLVVARSVRMSLRVGLNAQTPMALAGYGFTRSMSGDEAMFGSELGRLAIELNDRLETTSLNARVHFIYGVHAALSRPLHAAIDALTVAREAGLDNGDSLFASFATTNRLMLLLARGDRLDQIAAETEDALQLMRRTGTASSVLAQTTFAWFIARLRGRGPERELPDEHALLQAIERAGSSFARSLHALARAQLALYDGDRARLAAALAPLDRGAWNSGYYFLVERALLAGLAHARLHDAAPARAAAHVPSPGRAADHRAALERALAYYARWTETCPSNHLARALLLQAELARVRGDPAAALADYDQALDAARQHGQPHTEALASELAAAFHRSRGASSIAAMYTAGAIEAYRRWGARACAQRLTARHGDALARLQLHALRRDDEEVSALARSFDLDSVVQATQALTSERELDGLVGAIMRIMVRNAGAGRGVLVLSRDDALTIEAVYTPRGLATLDDHALSDALLPTAIVRLVSRSAAPVVLDDAVHDPEHAHDPYIRARRPRSLLCAPILRRGRTVGAIYLENELAAGVFTPARLEVLKLLTAQAAISIDNAIFYERLQAALAAAQEASRAKNTFLQTMSHELRTPLNAIIGYSEILQEKAEDRVDAEDMEDLDRILTASHHLLGIINDLIDITRIESGRVDFQPERFAIHELIADVVATIAANVARGGNELALELGDQLGEMYSDPKRIRQILINVLGNAAKFTEAGTVTLEVRRVAERVSFAISDTGIGIPAEHVERIFEPFAQVDGSRAREYEGTGLGLAICRQLCVAMGGTITATSALGQGSTFTVTLPAELPDGAAVAPE